MNTRFTIYPAIDLRCSRVVRLMEGDPQRQTQYSDRPVEMAQRWLDAGATWLHVVNLDGAFGEESQQNLQALQTILKTAEACGAKVQFGGGLRDLKGIDMVLELGVARAVVGTLAVRQPDTLAEALTRWGAERIAVSLDAWDEQVQTHGWKQSSSVSVFDLAKRLEKLGLHWLIYTDIARDGMQTGFNLQATLALARDSSMHVIASGGARSIEDVQAAHDNGLAGIILGRALYEGKIDLRKAITEYERS